MNSRIGTAALPLAGGLLTLAVLASIHGSAAEGSAYAATNILSKAAGTLGGFIAAWQFDRGDYMRRAWTLMGTCYGLLLLSTLAFGTSGHTLNTDLSPLASGARSAIIAVANLASIVATLLVSRTWSVAGLSLPVPRAARMVAMLASGAVGLALAGPSVRDDLHAITSGNFGSLAGLASDIGDIISFSVIAVIILTAFALRGGTLVWPWSLVAVSFLGWLLYDGVATIGDLLHLSSASIRMGEEAFRVMACLAQLSAGLLQRAVVRVSSANEAAPAT